jgi:hypothetical protein
MKKMDVVVNSGSNMHPSSLAGTNVQAWRTRCQYDRPGRESVDSVTQIELRNRRSVILVESICRDEAFTTAVH